MDNLEILASGIRTKSNTALKNANLNIADIYEVIKGIDTDIDSSDVLGTFIKDAKNAEKSRKCN